MSWSDFWSLGINDFHKGDVWRLAPKTFTGSWLLTECETSTELATAWTPAAAIPGAVIQEDDNFTFNPPAAADTDRVHIHVPGDPASVRFFRLKVIIP